MASAFGEEEGAGGRREEEGLERQEKTPLQQNCPTRLWPHEPEHLEEKQSIKSMAGLFSAWPDAFFYSH